MEIRPTYLIFVNGDNNNNKYYNCFPQGDYFRVEYGRVQGGKQTTTYPISKWNSQINSKLKKGYKDITDLKQDLIEEHSSVDIEYKPISNEEIRKIVAKLQSLAKETIDKNYTVTANTVTQAMIDKAQELIDKMVSCFQRQENLNRTQEDTQNFNDLLIKLFGVIPRKMSRVKDFLATEEDNLQEIIEREQELLDTMSSMVYVKPETNIEIPSQKEATILEELGLEFEEVTPEEIMQIKKLMNESQDKFRRAWKVTNLKTRKNFEGFVKAYDIKDTRLLFHGSRSENFWSIIRTGLLLRPTNAIRTGSLYGHGTYFAPKCQKSIGYTSLNNSYWAGGKSDIAYMALFEVAYGIPYDVYDFNSKYYNLNYNELQKFKKGATCLHAHAGASLSGYSSLKNDEIVVYKEEQTTIKYLIEIGN